MVVIGRNGAGKSSLLRCLAGVQEPTAGQVELGANVTIGYFAQEHEQVDLDVSVLENIDDTVLVRGDRAPGPAGLVRARRQGRPPDARHPVRR